MERKGEEPCRGLEFPFRDIPMVERKERSNKRKAVDSLSPKA